jgi:hypothetical protein
MHINPKSGQFLFLYLLSVTTFAKTPREQLSATTVVDSEMTEVISGTYEYTATEISGKKKAAKFKLDLAESERPDLLSSSRFDIDSVDSTKRNLEKSHLLLHSGNTQDQHFETFAEPLINAKRDQSSKSDLPVQSLKCLKIDNDKAGIHGRRITQESRDGGDSSMDATIIPVAIGVEYTDSGDTTDRTDVFGTGDVLPPDHCDYGHYPGHSFNGPDAWYTFTLTEAGIISASTCSTADFDTCLGILDESLNLVAVNDDGNGCTNYSSNLPSCELEPGTYYLLVDAYGENSGTYTLSVNFLEECVEYDCDGLPDEDEGWTMDNSLNGGCGADPVAFSTLEVPGEICGTFFTFNDGTTDNRDIDWYEIELLQDSYLTIEAFSCAPLSYTVLIVQGPCEGLEILYWADADLDGDLSISTSCLELGTYWVIVQPREFIGMENEELYHLTLEMNTCSHFPCEPITCSGSAEIEPNEGWNADPPNSTYNEIVSGETICGTTWGSDGSRDLDWFMIEHSGGDLEAIVEIDEFDVILFLADFDSEGTILASENSYSWCTSETLYFEGLLPGQYYIIVTQNSFYGIPAANYALTTYNHLDPCEDYDCTGIENEGEGWNEEDNYNGGCNSVPPVFSSLDVPGEICGTFYTLNSYRDIDWYEITLPEASRLSVSAHACIDANYAVAIAIGDCPAPDIIDFVIADGDSLNFTTDCLEAGDYSIIVLPIVFSGYPDEISYHLGLSAEECEMVDQCDSAIPILCNTTVTGSSTLSVGDYWDEYCFDGEDGPEVIYELNHPGGYLSIMLSSNSLNDLDLVLLGSCNPLDCLDMPWTWPEVIEGEYDHGTYYIVVDSYGWNGEEYEFELTVLSEASPCDGHVPISCDGTNETEPNEGWYADPPNSNFNEISYGETICGTIWAENGSRDQDWYLIDHPGGRFEAFVEIDEFDAVLILTDFDSEGMQLASNNSNSWCESETLHIDNLNPGQYFIVVTHMTTDGVSVEQNYALTASQHPDNCEDHVPIICDGTAEVEPNEGWNADPPNSNFNEITFEETVCGTVSANAGSRDLDWYHFVVERDDPISIEINAEMDNIDGKVFLTDFDDNGNIIATADASPACTAENLVYDSLNPGEYYIVFGPNDFYNWPDPVNYSLTLTETGVEVGDLLNSLSFELHQNYPNPFNPLTKISWDQPELAQVKLLVHNIRGELVQNVDLQLRVTGLQSFNWDGASLSSGVYFYSIETTGMSLTRKALLLK